VAAILVGASWALGAGPGAAVMTIDLDSTICEVHGKAKQGAAYGYTRQLGYPVVATRADTGEVLSCPAVQVLVPARPSTLRRGSTSRSRSLSASRSGHTCLGAHSAIACHGLLQFGWHVWGSRPAEHRAARVQGLLRVGARSS
jgi:hypothetical protein